MTELEKKEKEEALRDTVSYKFQELENAVEDLKKCFKRCFGEEIRKTKLYKYIKRLFRKED